MEQEQIHIQEKKRQVTSIGIEGMDCSDCALVIEHSVGRMDGVHTADVDYTTGELRVAFDESKIQRRTIERRVRALGYTVPASRLVRWLNENRELLFSFSCGGLLLIAWLGESFWGFPALLSGVLLAAAYLIGGWEIAHHALHAIRERQFDTDLLMAAAALGAAALGEAQEGALLVFLFSLGHALEERALDKAKNAVQALADLAPKTALVRRETQELEIPVDQVRLGDLVILKSGARIPVDGEVQAGQSAVNQAPVTGESLPVVKNLGDKVFAGTINGAGALEVVASRLAKDSTLARIMKLVEEAQAQKSPTQQTVEKFERFFVPAVLVSTALVMVIPPFFGLPLRESFMRAMTLLVAASPCALALGAPAAVLAGIAQAARGGVLVKGGAHLENLGQIKAVAFDKTGTLTRGAPQVTDLALYQDTFDQDQLVALAAAVESRSAHPLAGAVVAEAKQRGLEYPTIGEVTSFTGFGLGATLGERPVWIGNPAWLAEKNVALPEVALQQIETFYDQGKTVIALALDGQLVGVLALADVLRPEAQQAIKQLHQLGVEEVVMLTGDNLRAAQAVAGLAGVDRVAAELMPEQKLTAVRDLAKRRGAVAMVGDGVNDAPALANATVGIAMGSAGTAVALEAADVALMGSDLSRLPYAVGLGRATRAVIQQNLVIAVGVIALLALAALTGQVGLGLAVLFHEGSTLVVVANALRLLVYRS
jgi:Cd2+/Zn2+-exporting ATPase